MQATFEQALEIIKTLPSADLQKLKQWLLAQPPEKPGNHVTVRNEVRARRMAWLKANQERYGGQFVVMDGDRFLGVAPTYPKGRKLEASLGVPDAFVNYLSKPDEEGYMGGW
jgi:hypothetical protein